MKHAGTKYASFREHVIQMPWPLGADRQLAAARRGHRLRVSFGRRLAVAVWNRRSSLPAASTGTHPRSFTVHDKTMTAVAVSV